MPKSIFNISLFLSPLLPFFLFLSPSLFLPVSLFAASFYFLLFSFNFLDSFICIIFCSFSIYSIYLFFNLSALQFLLSILSSSTIYLSINLSIYLSSVFRVVTLYFIYKPNLSPFSSLTHYLSIAVHPPLSLSLPLTPHSLSFSFSFFFPLSHTLLARSLGQNPCPLSLQAFSTWATITSPSFWCSYKVFPMITQAEHYSQIPMSTAISSPSWTSNFNDSHRLHFKNTISFHQSLHMRNKLFNTFISTILDSIVFILSARLCVWFNLW